MAFAVHAFFFERETATILAALRYWQREGLMSAGDEQYVASDGGRFQSLSAEEIDTLCERINCDARLTFADAP